MFEQRWSVSAADANRVRKASNVHGRSAEQVSYMPSYKRSLEMWKLFSGSCKSQIAQSGCLWRLCNQQRPSVPTIAEIFLQLHSSKVPHAS
ncbi:hypothetical protein SLEP1_g1970 [Rubroshorea leprosula]|uniref:Uncharacterized protein n=1 Tax=Rubroshorea leprosula TaxID=152421 RepID=A0AAV5HRF3_9ROSI|nr:hypothetical protein SLEP1_g1970 [Rubroshorea leprosula]